MTCELSNLSFEYSKLVLKEDWYHRNAKRSETKGKCI